MNRHVFVVSLVSILSACGATEAPQSFQAENLIQKMPLPAGEWHLYQRQPKDANMLETRWVSKTSRDMAQTFVVYGNTGGDVTQGKITDDRIGSSKCDVSFDSQVLSDSAQNGYPQLTWMSECRNSDGYYSKTLHKTIAGNDSQYTFRRIFKAVPQDNQWQLWREYVDTIHVCDSRSAAHPCPDGFKRVK